jgi:8-oxo-dGTP pyrophosphatase MutT (NUDIX family)
VIYLGETLPPAFSASVYLACAGAAAFREELTAQLAAAGFDGVVFVPEPRAGGSAADAALEAWRTEALGISDVLVLHTGDGGAPSPGSLSLWADWPRTGRMIVCGPRCEGISRQAAQRLLFADTPADVAALVLKFLRPGAVRRAGERTVPLSLWRSPSFQSWYRALSRAGHFVEEIDVEWTHRSRGMGRPPFLWAMRPRVRVRGERRQLSGEVVIGRADVSVTVLYHRRPETAPLDTQVVLVREFRAAVRNRGGFAWMLPGGSAAQAGERRSDPRHTAVQEVFEETGLRLPSEQLQPVHSGDRQLVASLASYHAQVFRVELTDEQLAALLATAAAGKALGATPSERCFVSVRRLGDVLNDADFDWSHLGMLMYALGDLLGSRPMANPTAAYRRREDAR